MFKRDEIREAAGLFSFCGKRWWKLFRRREVRGKSFSWGSRLYNCRRRVALIGKGGKAGTRGRKRNHTCLRQEKPVR